MESLFVLSTKGEVVLEKHWRKVINRSITELFWNEVQAAKSIDVFLLFI